MYKRIKYFFTNNLYWKALSVLMAVVLWFVVMNINNPTEIKTFSLNISLLNEDKLKENNIAILNIDEIKSQKAEIKIRGTRTTLDEISKKANKDNIKLTLDLEQLLSYNISDEPLEVSASLKPSMPNIPYPNNNFEIVSFYPNTYNIHLDNIITIPKKIHPKTVGETKDGYIAYEPELSSEYIQVTGAKSIVDEIQVIYAEVDITNQTSTIEEKVIPVAYDKDGNEITDITFNMEDVSIKVPISLQGILSVVEPELVGELPEGYIVNNISYTPKTIEVIGNTDSLKNITKIILPEIDITGLTESTEYTYDISSILKQYNLRLKNSSNNQVEISIDISQDTSKSLSIPTNKISILGYNDEMLIDIPDEVLINVVGEDNLINNINIDDIKISIDVGDLNLGTHSVKVDVELPSGIKLLNEPYIDINITNKEQSSNEQTEQTSIQTNTQNIEETTIQKEITEEITQTESTTNEGL